MSGKPIDPKYLAELRTVAVPGNYAEFDVEVIIALILGLDHWETRAKSYERQVSDLQGREQVAWESSMAALERERAQTKRWRSQCPVTAEHVEAAGVSRVLAERWLHLAGVEPYDLMGHSTLWRDAGTLAHACTTSGSAADIATAISMLADDDPERCAHDILDEMATATPGGDL